MVKGPIEILEELTTGWVWEAALSGVLERYAEGSGGVGGPPMTSASTVYGRCAYACRKRAGGRRGEDVVFCGPHAPQLNPEQDASLPKVRIAGAPPAGRRR